MVTAQILTPTFTGVVISPGDLAAKSLCFSTNGAAYVHDGVAVSYTWGALGTVW